MCVIIYYCFNNIFIFFSILHVALSNFSFFFRALADERNKQSPFQLSDEYNEIRNGDGHFLCHMSKLGKFSASTASVACYSWQQSQCTLDWCKKCGGSAKRIVKQRQKTHPSRAHSQETMAVARFFFGFYRAQSLHLQSELQKYTGTHEHTQSGSKLQRWRRIASWTTGD